MKAVYTYLIALGWMVAAGKALAQNSSIDSLKRVIAQGSETEKLKAYVALANKTSTISFDETLKLSEQGQQLAQKLKDSLALAALKRSEGTAYYFKGEYDEAAERFYQALRIFESKQALENLAYIYNDIAKLYRKTRDLKRSLENYNRALALFQQLNDLGGVQMILNESGVVFEYEGNYEEALKRYTASMELAQQRKDSLGMSYSLNFIAGVYTLQKKFPQAESFNLRALKLRSALKDTFALALNYTDLGAMYAAWGKYEDARRYFNESINIARRMGYKELLMSNYAQMSELAKEEGNYKAAYEYKVLQTSLKDSIFNAEKTRQIEELNTLYETGKKEQQIREQQFTIRKRNLQLLLSISFFLLFILAAFTLYKRYRWKQEAKLQAELAKQKEVAASAVLQAEEKERSRIARDLHDGIGQIMSAARMNLSAFANKLVNSSSQQAEMEKIISLVDESCRELRAISHSMMPQALTNKGLVAALSEFIQRIHPEVLKINFHHEGFEERIAPDKEIMLFRIIQECINNVLKHAQATVLDISMLKDEDGISITLEDNGKGFDTTLTTDGMGLSNIRNRILFLQGTVDFDSTPGKGTLVAIHIP